MLTKNIYAWMTSFIIAASALPTASHAGQKVVVGKSVSPNSRVSIDRVDHRPWTELLRRYVDEQGNVDYSGWKRSARDRKALEDYLNSLSQAEPRMPASKHARLAFWINAYNSLTIHGILREYPTTSIRNHTPRLYGYHIWKDLLLIVGDDKYSLERIEHQVLRKMGDARIHFAIVCASRSCPKLRNEAYEPSTVDQQLDANARDFFSDRRNFQFKDGTFRLSSIIKWYASDFGQSTAEILKAISRYLPDDKARNAAASGRGRIEYLSYDWKLNDQRTAASQRVGRR